MSQAYAFIAGFNAMCSAQAAIDGRVTWALINGAACGFCLWRMAANMKKVA